MTLIEPVNMAAAEAYECSTDTVPTPAMGAKRELIGLWDWDVPNNKAYVDPPSATLFGIEHERAVRGLEVEKYTLMIASPLI